MSQHSYLQTRLRRLRAHPRLRALIREHRLSCDDFVLPLFIKAGHGIKTAITALPGHYQWSVDRLPEILAQIIDGGIPAVILFGIPECKDAQGSAALKSEGVIQQAIIAIKKQAPELLVITDLCFCEYTDHGHCGVGEVRGQQFLLDNDKTLELLAAQAISHAEAGADVLAPSGMLDGMVAALRIALDKQQFHDVSILSYAVKYASAFYQPFRQAAEGYPRLGDRHTYQMDIANGNEAIREVELDIAQGADMLMVKPAVHYLDVVYRVKQQFPHIPLGAYHVSGEYAMLQAAIQQDYVALSALKETLIAIKRAGADFIVTYAALDMANALKNDQA